MTPRDEFDDPVAKGSSCGRAHQGCDEVLIERLSLGANGTRGQAIGRTYRKIDVSNGLRTETVKLRERARVCVYLENKPAQTDTVDKRAPDDGRILQSEPGPPPQPQDRHVAIVPASDAE